MAAAARIIPRGGGGATREVIEWAAAIEDLEEPAPAADSSTAKRVETMNGRKS
jgi:hypothetical protein